MTEIRMELGDRSYNITVGSGLLKRAGDFFSLKRRVLVLTDSGVPIEYATTVAAQCGEAMVMTVDAGEGSKSLATLETVCEKMLRAGLGRSDCLVAVGGGVVGDLGGFAASVYMRGIDFYNVPTTLLSQVDSSIGGKTAVNLSGVKNAVGAFHQPRGVLIDTDVLATLPKRHIASGLSEALKMAITFDASLFSLIEDAPLEENLERIITGALMIKKRVVEADERESGLRRVLNFGHTLGHGIEASTGIGGLYHGECVALGMIPMCAPALRDRVVTVLNKIGIDTSYEYDTDGAIAFASHDKKCLSDGIEVILSDEVGTYKTRKMTLSEYRDYIKRELSH